MVAQIIFNALPDRCDENLEKTLAENVQKQQQARDESDHTANGRKPGKRFFRRQNKIAVTTNFNAPPPKFDDYA